MSDKWMSYANGYHSGYADASKDVSNDLVPILEDLIAELRHGHGAYRYALKPGEFCGRCQTDWPCPTIAAAQSAEARLREVTGDE